MAEHVGLSSTNSDSIHDVRSSVGTSKDFASFLNVATGLRLVFWGILIIIFSVLLGGPLSFMLVFILGPLALLVVPVGVLAGAATGLVGRCFCLSVPPKTGTKELIYAAVVCDLAAIAVSGLEFVVELPAIVSLATDLLPTVAIVLFVLFLRQLATHIGQHDLAKTAGGLLVVGGILVVLLVGMLIVLPFAPAASAAPGGFNQETLVTPVSCVGLLLMIAIVVQYLILLSRLRSAILRNVS